MTDFAQCCLRILAIPLASLVLLDLARQIDAALGGKES